VSEIAKLFDRPDTLRFQDLRKSLKSFMKRMRQDTGDLNQGGGPEAQPHTSTPLATAPPTTVIEMSQMTAGLSLEQEPGRVDGTSVVCIDHPADLHILQRGKKAVLRTPRR